MAARNLAMVQLAVFDAVNSIDPRYEPYGGIQVRATRGASMVAAVAGAADEVLRALYPDQAATFDATLAETLGHGPWPLEAGPEARPSAGRWAMPSWRSRADDGSDAIRRCAAGDAAGHVDADAADIRPRGRAQLRVRHALRHDEPLAVPARPPAGPG